jgi:hypothetical protein
MFFLPLDSSSVSQTGYRRTSVGVPRQIVEYKYIYIYFKTPNKILSIPGNFARIFVRQLQIVEGFSCANNRLFVYIPAPQFSLAGVSRDMNNSFRVLSTEKNLRNTRLYSRVTWLRNVKNIEYRIFFGGTEEGKETPQ